MITWQNGTEGSTEIETGDYVTINGVNYPVKTKIQSSTPLSAENLNENQSGLMDFSQQNDESYLPVDNKKINIEGVKDLPNILNKLTEYMTIGVGSNYVSSVAEKIKFNTIMFRNTEKLSLVSNAIQIGAGVSQVEVSANCFAQQNDQDGSYIWTRIRKMASNGTTEKKSVSCAIASCKNYYGSAVETPMPVDVEEGDIIDLYKITTSSYTIRGQENTYLTVKIIK